MHILKNLGVIDKNKIFSCRDFIFKKHRSSLGSDNVASSPLQHSFFYLRKILFQWIICFVLLFIFTSSKSILLFINKNKNIFFSWFPFFKPQIIFTCDNVTNSALQPSWENPFSMNHLVHIIVYFNIIKIHPAGYWQKWNKNFSQFPF